MTKGEPSFRDPAAARTRPNPRRFDRMPSECHFTRPRNSKPFAQRWLLDIGFGRRSSLPAAHLLTGGRWWELQHTLLQQMKSGLLRIMMFIVFFFFCVVFCLYASSVRVSI